MLPAPRRGSDNTGHTAFGQALITSPLHPEHTVVRSPALSRFPAHAPDQAAGIRFISFRNEQAAGYAAAAAGFLTGSPSVLLTVSGPGAVHGIAGLSHAHVNCWPLLMLSGSAEQVSVASDTIDKS